MRGRIAGALRAGSGLAILPQVLWLNSNIWKSRFGTPLRIMTRPKHFMSGPGLALFLAAAMNFLALESTGAVAADTQNAIPDGRKMSSLSDADVRALGSIVARLMASDGTPEAIPDVLTGGNLAVHIVLRAEGAELASAWANEATGLRSLGTAIQHAKAGAGGMQAADTVELELAHDFHTIAPGNRKKRVSNIHRGVRGIELQYRGRIYRYGPTQMIADNTSFEYELDRFQKRYELSDANLSKEVILRYFEAAQFLVHLGPEVETERLFRGNQVVPLSAVTRENVEALSRRLADWMVRNLHADGRMTYKYWPSRRREATSNNMIRQWMATVCLDRIARQRDTAALQELTERNIRYNLDHFYRIEAGRGFIWYRGKAKLGAAALAALAIVEHPNRAAFAAEEMALRRTVALLWQGDGSFRTFYKPIGRNDVQNFYPGEALLLWAFLYRESGDADLLQRIMKSYRYYRAWHLKHRNPAFIPWHTQAYYIVWKQTRDPELRDWIFEMNDWLLGMQRRAGAVYPDTDGRFYDPTRPFGPPHASSTGVYLEGLIDAHQLAREVGDANRAEAYRQAIVRGVRSAMQLEFSDRIDMFYVPGRDRDRVRGALRTTVYRNEIRVDNVQHVLMALQKILLAFTDAEYR